MRRINFEDHHDYGYEVPPCSRRDLILHAHAVHKVVGYKGERPFPILKLVEHVFPRMCDDYIFDILPEAEMGDNLGKTEPDKHHISIREDVYNAATKGSGLARMVVAHESVHLLRHEGVSVSMAFRQANKKIPAYKSSEWQANAMAGALLMPASKIILMNTDEIVDTYQVTPSAAEMQLRAIREEARKWNLPVL